jgi:nucleotide-binding universal stress UspA family protein
MIGRIAHPTDFSELSTSAFLHALRLAVAAQCSIDLLHVKSERARQHWESFPHVREALANWGVLEPQDLPADIAAKAGIIVRKAEIDHAKGPAAGIFQYLAEQPANLIVTAPHDHGMLNRWVSGSVSEEIALRTHCPSLFIGERAKPFVDKQTGSIKLSTVLVPIDHTPSPHRVIEHLTRFFTSFGLAPDYALLHVGEQAPVLYDDMGQKIPVTRATGPVAQAILEHADAEQVDLIAMPTAGHDGFLDILRGSTTERVMRQARCPLLAIPAQSLDR